MNESVAKPRILLVEDDDLYRRSLTKILRREFDVSAAADGLVAVDQAREFSPDVVLLDIMMPGKSGLEVLSDLKSRWPDLVVIMLTAVEKVESVVQAMKLGAFDYLSKPVDSHELQSVILRALEAHSVRQGHGIPALPEESSEHRLMGGTAMAQVRRDISTVAPTDATVLIYGETGTGKELVARSIHEESSRSSGPFVAINCAGIPADLVESELFGHARGAFTGAHARSQGKFELAHGGTLFLDEVGELPLEAQGKLLRILEERSFYPVGSNQLVDVEVRVIAATNRPLEDMTADDGFRRDLYYRLAVFCFDLPPLRERSEDVKLLANRFLKIYASKFNRRCVRFSEEALQWLGSQRWDGNVRELRNAVERAVLRFDEEILTSEALQGNSLRRTENRDPVRDREFSLPAEGADLEEIEKKLLIQALERAEYNKTKAAALLNLSPPTFYYRLKKYGLD